MPFFFPPRGTAPRPHTLTGWRRTVLAPDGEGLDGRVGSGRGLRVEGGGGGGGVVGVGGGAVDDDHLVGTALNALQHVKVVPGPGGDRRVAGRRRRGGGGRGGGGGGRGGGDVERICVGCTWKGEKERTGYTVNHGYKSNGYKSKTLIRAEVLNQNQNGAFMK